MFFNFTAAVTILSDFGVKKIKSVTIPLNKGQKQYRSNRSRRYEEEVVSTHGRTIQKGLNDPDNNDGVITHLQPDILECAVKWALGNITINKASKGDGIPTELFQILKDYVVKVLHSICQPTNLENSAVATDWKRLVLIPIPKKGNAKEYSNYHTIALIFHVTKLMLKILQARLQ